MEELCETYLACSSSFLLLCRRLRGNSDTLKGKDGKYKIGEVDNELLQTIWSIIYNL